jgi:hypothetical protein
VEIALPKIDELLRKAIQEKRLIQFVYRGKPRIIEPHDYGIHKGVVKLFGYQVGGLSSEPLPNWRWALVNSISNLRLRNERFPGRRPNPSGRHHQWDQIFARVEPPEEVSVAAQRCGSSSSSLVIGNSAMRDSTSVNQPNGSTFTNSQEVTKQRNTAAVLPLRSLPKKVQLARPTAKQRSARSV